MHFKYKFSIIFLGAVLLHFPQPALIIEGPHIPNTGRADLVC